MQTSQIQNRILTLVSSTVVVFAITGCGAMVDLANNDGDDNNAANTNSFNNPPPSLKGELDTSYSSDGIADDNTLSGIITAWGGMLVAPNGAAAVASMGPLEMVAGGYDATGTALPALVNINAVCAALSINPCFINSGLTQTDGKYVVGLKPMLSPVLKIVRFTADGNLDTSFGGTGIVTINAWTMNTESFKIVERQNGKLAFLLEIGASNLAGFQPAVLQLNSDGSIDTSFGVSGLAAVTLVWNSYDMDIDHDTGHLYLAGKNGSIPSPNQIVRLLANGSEDTAFGTSGLADMGNSDFDRPKIAFDKLHRKLVLATGNDSSSGSVRRLNLDGTLDSSFGTAGVVTFSYTINSGVDQYFNRALKFEGDKIIVLGDLVSAAIGMMTAPSTVTKLTRLNADGTLDSTFGTNGLLELTGTQKMYSMDFSPDGKLYLGGVKVTYTQSCMMPMPGMGFPGDCMPGMFMTMPTSNAAQIVKVK